MDREELRDRLWHHSDLDVVNGYILPIIDAYAAAERERLAQAVENLKVDSPHPDAVLAAAYHTAIDDAARIVREGTGND